jgi:hypothetical protein
MSHSLKELLQNPDVRMTLIGQNPANGIALLTVIS